MVEKALPQRTHTYQNHTLDSTRWDAFTPRDDDIVIATPPDRLGAHLGLQTQQLSDRPSLLGESLNALMTDFSGEWPAAEISS